jgi:hypothetical protein
MKVILSVPDEGYSSEKYPSSGTTKISFIRYEKNLHQVRSK